MRAELRDTSVGETCVPAPFRGKMIDFRERS